MATIRRGNGNDRINTGSGEDYAYGGGGDDNINGAVKADGTYAYYESSGTQWLYGEGGNDTIFGGTDVDNIEGGTGNDYLNGLEGNDVISGGEGDDELQGRDGNDTLNGGAGNDKINTGSGEDYAYGGGGDDNINGVLNSDGTYTYYESSGTQWLYGEGGNDTIFGGTDVDNIEGGTGNDYLNGLEGNDVISGGDGEDKLRGDEGNDTLNGNDGNDQIYGEDGNDTLNGNDGNDKIYSGDGIDSADGGAGDDTLNSYLKEGSKILYGSEGNDTIWGGVDDDFIYGGDGDDPSLSGYAGNDTVYGGEGNDELFGGEGNDTLNGGLGVDYMVGGEGDDTYYVDDIWDVVYDTNGNDTLHISVDYYNADSTIENIQYSDGVKKLPYWIDALITDHSSVNHHHYLENDKTFKYLFPQQVLSYFNAKDLNGWSPAESSLEAAFVNIISLLSKLVDANFVQTANAYQANTIAVSTNAQTVSAGYASHPDPNRTYKNFSNSDIFMDDSYASPSLSNPNYDLDSLVHELGHALGLKHPFSAIDPSGTIAPPPYLESSLEDNNQWTAISYTDSSQYYSASFRPLDLAALQYLYGVSTSANAGNTTFTFNKSEGTFVYDGQGIDKIDATNAATAATIYLTQGDWSYIGVKSDLITAKNQLTINFNTVIEDVWGGSFNDNLHGNQIGNTMLGNNGNDTIFGYLGNDILYGENGDDTLYGGAGNDQIYTGLGNDYAYGGNGDDDINGSLTPEGEYLYEYETSSGTQWLYGNDGNDTIIGGSDVDNIEGGIGNDYLDGLEGNDVISGGEGDDHLDGWYGDDKLNGNDGNDFLAGGDGSDSIDGGSGFDSAVYFSNISQYSILNSSNKIWTISDVLDSSVDHLQDIERIHFTDKSVALDIGAGDTGGSCYRIYKAAFNRTPDEGGLGYWIGQMDLGKTLVEVSAGFIDSDEFRASYGTNPSNGEFLTKVYNNVLGRDPDSGGYDWWVDQLANNPEKTWDKVMADFSEGTENQANVSELIGNGVQYDLWTISNSPWFVA